MKKKEPKASTIEVVPAPAAEQKPDTAAWPVVKETRQLECRLAPGELTEKGNEIARLTLKKTELEDKKKSATSQFKAQIDSAATDINLIAHVLRDGAEYRTVKCEWHYEQAGFDNERKPVFHPEKKTLVRLDNGEAVEVRTIEDHERQLKLNLESEQNADAAPQFTGDTSSEEDPDAGEQA